MPTAAVLALEVDPSDNVYVGLNGGTIGGRANFTRLDPTGALDLSGFWNVAVQPPFQTSVNGPVRAIKYSPNLFGIGSPGVVVGGTFTQATGGTSQNVGNIALFDLNGQVDFFFPTTGGGANGTVNALAVAPAPPGTFDQIFAGGEFSFFNQVARPRVAKFTSVGLDLTFNPPPAVADTIPNPVQALVLTDGAFSSNTPFTILHVGGRQNSPSNSASVGLNVINATSSPSLTTRSPFFTASTPSRQAFTRAMAANASTGALFGGEFFGGGGVTPSPTDGEKLVATFNTSYNPTNGVPVAGGLPSFVFLKGASVGPTQFYASALVPPLEPGTGGLLRPGDLLIGGDVGPDSSPTPNLDTVGNTVELYRITPCGEVTVIARFRNVSGYLVRNDIDNGAFVGPQDDINTAPGMGFRRVDNTDPASIRAIAVDPQGRVYVGGQFNQVSDVRTVPLCRGTTLSV